MTTAGKRPIAAAQGAQLMARIKRQSDDLLAEIAADPPDGWAVNWADLRVTEIVACRNHDGDELIEVVVAEASPDSPLGPVLHARLQKVFGVGVVAVRTEW